MSRFAHTQVFNNPKIFVSGWYWTFPSHELKKNKIKSLNLMGREIVIYRGASGDVSALDAYCPHMGAHFQEGRVEENSIRCGFHNWKFGSSGACTEIPCQKYKDRCANIPPVTTHPVQEKYGMIWVHAGDQNKAATDPLPYFEDLGPGADLEFLVGRRTFRQCRPEVVMLNAIDAHHFNAVHPEASLLADGMEITAEPQNQRMIRLKNTTGLPKNWIGRILQPLYRNGVLNYKNEYWYASTGVVSLGPDFLQFRLIFPHRPTLNGGTEGHMIFLTPKRRGILGKILARGILWLTDIVGSYFEKGDKNIFDSIKFAMRAPVKADHAMIGFIKHTEAQVTQSMPWVERDNELKGAEVVAIEVLDEERITI